MIIAGDNYYDFSISNVIEEFNLKNKPILCLYDIKSLEEAKRFGVVEVTNGVVMNFSEKPQMPKSTLISTGIYAFKKENLNHINEYLKDGNNADSPGYFVQWLINKTELHSVIGKGTWIDIGTIESYMKIFKMKHNSDLPD